jgi:predicted RND superfamily exporter protein
MQDDIITITGLIFILFGAYLFWRYRHMSAILYLVTNMLLSILITLCLFPLFGYQMTAVSILALPIVLVLSLSDVVHLLGGIAKGQSSTATISKIWVPSLLSSLTTAIAFFSFQFNDAPNMVQLGTVTGTAVILEFLVSVALAQQFLHKVRLRKEESPVIMNTSHFLERHQKTIGWGLLGLVLCALLLLPKLRFEATTDDFFPDEQIAKILRVHRQWI